jgi:single-strand DNA-binding protein
MIELNKVLLSGRLTRDPELRYIPSGAAVCDLGLAVGRKFYDKNTGTTKEETCFINATAWEKTAEFCQKYLDKGSAVFVEGRLKQDTWQDKDGNKREKISIVADRIQFAESRADAEARRAGGGARNFDRSPAPEDSGNGDSDQGRQSAPSNTEDDVPF